MSNTSSEAPAQAAPETRIGNRVQFRLDRIEEALQQIETAVATFDDELDELTGLTSEDGGELADDLRDEAQAMLRALGTRFKDLCREVETSAEDDAEAAS